MTSPSTIKVLNDRSQITHIIHISDLHVRAGDREKARIIEYGCVFAKFINDIKNLEYVRKSAAIIAVSGDIFHNKTYVGVEGTNMLLGFIIKLLMIAPVIVISGNHDSLQQDTSDVDSIDMLQTAFSETKTRFGFYYLKETGLYRYGNIGFGIVAVRDVLKSTSGSGSVEDLPDYPNPDAFDSADGEAGVIDVKVAMFHGSVFKNTGVKSGYPIEWFVGYDFGVFGDCHRQQINKTGEMTWGYPGSLIQQDNGESTNGHGYLVWNVRKKECNTCDIKNEYGLITMQKKDDKWYVRFGVKNIKEFNDAVNDPIFPKHPKIRFLGSNTDKTDLEKLLDERKIVATNIQATISVGSSIFEEFGADGGEGEDENGLTNTLEANLNAICDMNNKENWVRYVNEIYPDIDVADFFEKPSATICIVCDDKMPDEIKTKIKNRNESITQLIDKYEQVSIVHNKASTIRFKHMEWDYILCYGKGNSIDFTKLRSKITLINGLNATGKSAFLDVISLCIYGQPTSLRTQVNMGKVMSSKIISDQKPHHERSGISLTFECDDKTYEISRSFNCQSKDDSRINTFDITVSEIVGVGGSGGGGSGGGGSGAGDADGYKTVIAEMAVANEWITQHFGKSQNMELANMMCQIDTNNFFMQTNEVQREILEKAMNMESISAYSEIIAESIRGYKYITDALKTFKSGMNEHTTVTITAEQVAQYEKLKEDIDGYINNLKELDAKRIELIGLKGKMDKEIKNEDLSVVDKILDKRIERAASIVDGFNIADDEYLQIIQTRTLIVNDLNKINDAIEVMLNKAEDEDIDLRGGGDEDDDGDGDELGEEPKCKMTLEAIEAMEDRYNEWISQQLAGWLANPDGLSDEIENIKANILKYQERIHYFEKLHVNKPKSGGSGGSGGSSYERIATKDLEGAIHKLNELKQRQSDLMQNRIVPCRLKENKVTWEAKYEKWKKQVGDADESGDAERLKKRLQELIEYTSKIEKKFERINTIQHRQGEITAEIAEIEKEPYNKDCHACNERSSRKRLAIISNEYKDLGKELAKLKKSVNAIETITITSDGGSCVIKPDFKDLYDEINELPSIISKREFYESTYETMTEEVKAWEQAALEWKQMKENAAELAKIDCEIVKDEWNIYESYKYVMEKNTNLLADNKELLINMTNFLRSYDEYHKLSNDIDDNVAMLNKWKEWNIKKHRLDYKKLVLDKRAKEAELNDCVSKAEDIEKLEAAKNDLAYWRSVKVQKEYLRVNADYNEISDKLAKMRNRYAVLGKTIEDAEKHNIRVGDITNMYNSLMAKYELLQKIQKCIIGDPKKNIEGFRHWIFVNKALPLVESEMNGFLSEIDSIQVNIGINSNGFIYTLSDRGNTPSMNTISGYQKFIVNLAMRMALTRIGNKVSVDILFIDEGFTSFDSVNINKIRDIFKILLQRFGSIMIVSHMDIVRDVVDTSIDIQRSSDNKTSRVFYGDHYPRYKKTKGAATDAAAAAADGNMEGVAAVAAAPKKRATGRTAASKK